MSSHPAAARVIALYNRHVDVWENNRHSRLPEGEQYWIDRFIQLLPATNEVLDLGCGTGLPIARFLGDHGLTVMGIDGSEQMISRFRLHNPAQTALVADMRTLALAGKWSGIIAWCSLFHLPPMDQRRMFPVFSEHTIAGAPLLFNTGPYAGESIGEFEGEPLYHASLSTEEYELLLDRHGFDVIYHVVEDPDCFGYTVWLAVKRDEKI